jgi:hypothetical protein
MKAPTKVTFRFDPDKADIPALTDFCGRILWACIRTQHIVNQFFNGEVQSVALRIAEVKPKNYEDFKTIIASSGLRVFGTFCPKSERLGIELYPELDDEFWQGVWEYITGKKKLEIVVI